MFFLLCITTDEDGKKRGVSMEKVQRARKKEVPTDNLSLPNQNTILINIKWYYYTRYGKKYNEIQLTKNKIDLNNQKMRNHPPSPGQLKFIKNNGFFT